MTSVSRSTDTVDDGAQFVRGKFADVVTEQRIVALVPAPGHYRARSFSWLRRLIGMSAEIVVE